MSDLQHPDPRMGDEDEESTPQNHHETHHRHRKEVKLHLPALSSTSSDDSNPKKEDDKAPPKKTPWYKHPVAQKVLPDLQWIPANLTVSKLKPVIRSSIVAFVSVILLVILRVEHTLGNVSNTYFTPITEVLILRAGQLFDSHRYVCL